LQAEIEFVMIKENDGVGKKAIPKSIENDHGMAADYPLVPNLVLCSKN
jgi:hypothetical protein